MFSARLLQNLRSGTARKTAFAGALPNSSLKIRRIAKYIAEMQGGTGDETFSLSAVRRVL